MDTMDRQAVGARGKPDLVDDFRRSHHDTNILFKKDNVTFFTADKSNRHSSKGVV
ncbi:MAG: hypothetical protein NPIRA01_35260 [Nitrospirales bacterium]|nr:MAG: hypothetical protein NPIRA01_35260 [Nitrospirales bacterium]